MSGTQMSEFKQKVLTAAVDRYVLTKTQCEMLRQDAEVIGMKRATVLKKDGTTRRSFARSCSSCWIPYAQHNNWIYNIMREITVSINEEHWRFDVGGVQQLQILKYNPLQQFWWHFDTYTGSDRKLTAVVNLSAPNEYLGGGLQVKADIDNAKFIREQGAGCWFPSYIEHRARAPIWGTRWVLVAWFTGPAWR
jgi:PKHD-type hydroxylase